MRIAFIGASMLGFNCCEAIIKAKHNVVGILTLGEEFSIKYSGEKERSKVKNYLHKDFSEFRKYGVEVVYAVQPLSEAYKQVTEWHPELIIVIGWYYLIPESLMKIPSKGVIGIHGSLLPKYRGNAPLVWAVINGEKETGVSLFYIGKGIDEGDIIGQSSFSIEESDYIADVLKKAEDSSIQLLLEYLPQISAETAPRMTQDHSIATYFPKRTPEDGKIDWSWDAGRIRNFIRAQSKPYPGAFTIIGNKKVHIWEADIHCADSLIQ